MGLDAVEIVMEIEDEFGIQIRPDEQLSIRTVGDLIALIQRRIDAALREPCPNIRAFHSLRRLVHEMTGNSELRFRPSHRIEDWLSPDERRRLWKRLREQLELFPPPLSLSRTAYQGLLIAVRVAFAVICYRFAFDPVAWSLAIAIGAVIGIMLVTLIPMMGTRPPNDWQTFGDMTRHIAGLRVATKNLQIRSEESILAVLQPMLGDILCIAPQKVVPSALLVEDLGMD